MRDPSEVVYVSRHTAESLCGFLSYAVMGLCPSERDYLVDTTR